MSPDQPDKSKNSAALRFDTSNAQPIAIAADKSWWKKNEYRISGLMRVISRGATITSGMGVGAKKSPYRVAYGGMGLAAGAFLAAFGKKAEKKQIALAASDDVAAKRTGRIYHGLVSASGLVAILSGRHSGRILETLSGIWTMGWSAFAMLAPEESQAAPKFDNGTTQAKPVGYADAEEHKGLLETYKKNPKKLAADMLQLGAFLATAEGIKNKDMGRFVAGVTLGASNYLQRDMRDIDFGVAAQQGATR